MFGIRVITKQGLEKLEAAAKNQALADLIDLLRKADRIVLEPMTLVGDNQTIAHNVFLGTGLTIKSSAQASELTDVGFDELVRRNR